MSPPESNFAYAKTSPGRAFMYVIAAVSFASVATTSSNITSHSSLKHVELRKHASEHAFAIAVLLNALDSNAALTPVATFVDLCACSCILLYTLTLCGSVSEAKLLSMCSDFSLKHTMFTYARLPKSIVSALSGLTKNRNPRKSRTLAASIPPANEYGLANSSFVRSSGTNAFGMHINATNNTGTMISHSVQHRRIPFVLRR